MFCNACGKELQIGQQACGACGQPVGVGTIPRSVNRVSHHIQLLGVLWIVYSVLPLVAGVVLFILAATLFNSLAQIHDVPPQGLEFVHTLFVVIAVVLLVKSAVGIAAGTGLLQRQTWARVLAIVLGIIILLNIPFGTALGIYTLWALFSPESQREYESLARR
jgi:hypothetical protein